MCGRFKAGFEFREIKVRWQIFNDLDFTPHYNIAPTQTRSQMKIAIGEEVATKTAKSKPIFPKQKMVALSQISSPVGNFFLLYLSRHPYFS